MISDLLSAPGMAQVLPSTIRTITRSTATTTTIDPDWPKFVSSLGWPLAVIICVWLVIKNLEKLSQAIRGAPFISKIGIGPVQIELDRSHLDKIKTSTEESFAEILKKTNTELTAFSDSLLIPFKLEAASNAIIVQKFGTTKPASGVNLRFTTYVPDTVFKDFLYELTAYFIPKHSKAKQGKGPGRRFSKRYGIIGLSWRTDSSRGVGQAFQGTQNEVQDLIEDWSMTEEEAEHARLKPSCLAIIARDTQFNKQVGLIYVDGEKKDVFGTDTVADAFAKSCEVLPEVGALADALINLHAFASQIKLDFDLTRTSK